MKMCNDVFCFLFGFLGGRGGGCPKFREQQDKVSLLINLCGNSCVFVAGGQRDSIQLSFSQYLQHSVNN